jgi:hypothetical protein
MTASETLPAIEAVWRIEAPRLIAGLARLVRDVGHAEDLAQDALVAALEQWPTDGIPRNPGAWLMTAAKRRAIDEFRRGKLLERKHAELGYEIEALQRTVPKLDEAIDDRLLPAERVADISCLVKMEGVSCLGDAHRHRSAPTGTLVRSLQAFIPSYCLAQTPLLRQHHLEHRDHGRVTEVARLLRLDGGGDPGGGIDGRIHLILRPKQPRLCHATVDLAVERRLTQSLQIV